jgi:nucleotidyltransferase/DNA polymerase involved in DNA repair
MCFIRSKEYMDTTPVAVAHSKSAGSSEISSCNYAARAFGVSSGKHCIDTRHLMDTADT